MENLSNKAREARNSYQRAWRRKNPELLKQYNNEYWERKADPVGSKVRKLSKEGMSQREISAELGISLGTVNAILNT